jgi:hypothetical protein
MILLSALYAAGRRRSPATLPGYHAGARRVKGMRYPTDPPTVDEIRRQVSGSIMARACGSLTDAFRGVLELHTNMCSERSAKWLGRPPIPSRS